MNTALTVSGPSGTVTDGIVHVTLPDASVMALHDCVPIESVTLSGARAPASLRPRRYRS